MQRLQLPVALLLAGVAGAAFEPVAQSPWLEGGYASCIFPRSPMASRANPALAGLLESTCFCASASRPFGLRELDRAALGAGASWGSMATCGILTGSGSSSYSEFCFSVPVAWRVSDGFLLGAAPALHRISVSGYGSASAFSADCGAVCRPLEGLYFSAGLCGFLRTRMGSSGDPVVPLSAAGGIGVCPLPSTRISAGVSRQEGLPLEASASAAFFPAEAFGLEVSFQSDPARFAAAFCIDVSMLEVACGYAEHPALGGTPAVELVWGLPSFVPGALAASGDVNEASPPPGPVDINSAGIDELCALPGIGPARAEAIVRWREMYGPFRSIDQLADVPGISANLVDGLRSLVVLE